MQNFICKYFYTWMKQIKNYKEMDPDMLSIVV